MSSFRIAGGSLASGRFGEQRQLSTKIRILTSAGTRYLPAFHSFQKEAQRPALDHVRRTEADDESR